MISFNDILDVLKILVSNTLWTCQFNSKIICLCKRFVDQCDMCRKMFVRDSPAPTVGQKLVGGDCQVRLHILEIFHMAILFVSQATKSNGRNCRGKLRDFVLDWEAELPQEVRVLMPRFCLKAFMFSIFSGPGHVWHPQYAGRPEYCLGLNFAGEHFLK